MPTSEDVDYLERHRSDPRVPDLPGEESAGGDAEEKPEPLEGTVVGFGLFDPFADEEGTGR